MDGLSGYFASPVWWFSVVAVGAAVNVLAAYLKPALDRLGSLVSTRWSQRTERLRAERRERIRRLQASEGERLLATIEVVNKRVEAVHQQVFALFFITMIGMMLNADFDFDKECIHVAS